MLDSSGTGLFPLLSHYRQTFAHFWRQRAKLVGPHLTIDEAEFSPPALALEERPVSPTIRLTAAILILLVLFAIAWSILGRIDIYAKASGKVIPGGRTKTIASVDTATVRAIHVGEGQTVRAGDVLLELDATPFEADRDKASGDERQALLQMARSRALLEAVETAQPPRLKTFPGLSATERVQEQSHLDAQYADFAAKLAQAEADIREYEQALPLAQRREEIYGSLVEARDVSTDAWLEKKQARMDTETHLADARSARATLIAQTKRQALDDFAEAAKTAADAEQDAIHAGSHAHWLTLRAPEDGTVQQLTVHSPGAVVEAAQPIMVIVPRVRRVEIEASVANKDVGFIRIGQHARVKVAAFEYTKYGTVPGTVDFIANDAVEDKDHQLTYPVRVVLDQPTIAVRGHSIELSPGMSVDVDIMTGRRRVIDYLLSPLQRQGQESLHER